MTKAADRLGEGDLGPALRSARFCAHANQGQDTYGDRFSGTAPKVVRSFHSFDRSDSFTRPCCHLTNIASSAREDRPTVTPVILLKDFVPLQAKLSESRSDQRILIIPERNASIFSRHNEFA
jgi:hypothetical protein